MSDQLIELFQQYANGQTDLAYLLSRLPQDETIGTLADLLDEFYDKHYEG